jgi:outer membrane protein assembly factor BamB
MREVQGVQQEQRSTLRSKFAQWMRVLLALASSVAFLASACRPLPSAASLLKGNRRIVSNTLPLQQKWIHPIDEFLGDPMSSQGNQVYVWQGGLLEVLDARTGQLRWTVRGDAALGHVTAVSEDAVAYDKNNLVHEEIAVREPQTGDLRWASPITTTYSLAIGEGRLYAGWYGRVGAYALADGRLLWLMSQGLPSHTGINVYYDAPYLDVLTYDHLYVLNAQDGTVVKSFDYVDTRLEVVSEGSIYGVGSPNVYATDAQTGTVRWKTPVLPLAGYLRPTLLHDTLYVITEAGKLFALDTQTGAQKWVGENIDKAFSNVVEFNHQGYVITEDGRLHGFDLATGREIGQLDTGVGISRVLGFPAIPSLVVAERTLVFSFGDGYVYGFEAKSP